VKIQNYERVYIEKDKIKIKPTTTKTQWYANNDTQRAHVMGRRNSTFSVVVLAPGTLAARKNAQMERGALSRLHRRLIGRVPHLLGGQGTTKMYFETDSI